MRVKQSGKSRPARTLPWERRQRKTLRTIYLVVALTILVMGFPKLYFHWQMARENRLIRAMGLPATLDEMNRDGPDTPTVTEAEAYAKAFEILTAKEVIPQDWSIRLRIEDAALDHPFASDLLRDMQKNVSQYSQALDLLEIAVQFPIHRYPAEIRERYRSEHSLAAGLSDAVHQLAFAALLAAERHDPDETCRRLLTMMTVIESMRFEYADGGLYSRTRHLRFAQDALMHALALVAFTDEQLASLTKVWLDADDPLAVVRMLAVSRQKDLQIFQYPQWVMGGHRDRWGALDDYRPNTTKRLLVTTDILGWNAGDKVRFLREMRDLISISLKPWHTFLPGFDQREYEYFRRFSYPHNYVPRLSQHILCAMMHFMSVHFQSTAELRVSAAALGLERYRLRYGQYPAALDQLVPDFLPVVPVDPADGVPLRYCFTETGVAVYSISIDLKDDGAVPPAIPRHPRCTGDTIFELRPARGWTDSSTRAEPTEDEP
jgi:hypothetical protein